jgi:hypothetical protein
VGVDVRLVRLVLGTGSVGSFAALFVLVYGLGESDGRNSDRDPDETSLGVASDPASEAEAVFSSSCTSLELDNAELAFKSIGRASARRELTRNQDRC